MITFLRKIRKGLLNENNFSKYLLYALGEILLVVVGILIALQVNNWNQKRNERKVEQQILLNIKDALQTDLDNAFSENLQAANQIREASNDIIDAANRQGPMTPDQISFRDIGLRRKFRPAKTAYKILESQGSDIIQNEALKLAILNMYDLDYALIEDRFENHDFNLRDLYRPRMRKHLNIMPRPEQARKDDGPSDDPEGFRDQQTRFIPKDFKAMLADEDFMSMIAVLNSNAIGIKGVLEETEVKIRELIGQIEEELKQF